MLEEEYKEIGAEERETVYNTVSKISNLYFKACVLKRWYLVTFRKMQESYWISFVSRRSDTVRCADGDHGPFVILRTIRFS